MGRISALHGERERVELRTRTSKSFQTPDGRIRSVTRLYPVHHDISGSWTDIDDTPVSSDGVTWKTADTSYDLSWQSDTLTLFYRSRKGGDSVQVRLVQLDGVPIAGAFPAPTITGRSIRSVINPSFELELRVRGNGVELYKLLKDDKAPKSLTWEVTEGDSSFLRLDLMNTSGHDAKKRRVEITHTRTPDDLSIPGKKSYLVTETFTSRVRLIDPLTSARSWVNEVQYPVLIDVTITDHITANDDDGHARTSLGDYWYNTVFSTGNTIYASAFRFLSVNIPQGQTLDSASIAINVTARSGSQTGTFAGQAVDSAPAWANHSAFSPASMAATTATLTYTPPGATGIQTLDVKAIAQEIINRAGWAANNNMRFGFTVVSGMTTSYSTIEDYSAAGTSEAVLTIVYTPAATGASIMWVKA